MAAGSKQEREPLAAAVRPASLPLDPFYLAEGCRLLVLLVLVLLPSCMIYNLEVESLHRSGPLKIFILEFGRPKYVGPN
jgi:hypothetical protein